MDGLDITIRKLTAEDRSLPIDIDDTFTVNSTMVLSLKDNQIGYTLREIPAYEKSYAAKDSEETGDMGSSEYIDHPDRAIYAAFASNRAIGQIVLKRNWNQYAYVEDIKVDKQFRGHGVGRRLIEQAKLWAQGYGMPGIMLETQSNNVKACRFYESCGFVIGGFDSYLYKGIHRQSDEIALYWYLLFD
ncbi:GNAT family N-acetyltransferase [Paenibacillus hamazuiensis]|uniref:GNAT family N-acetyltransferase n=1 Tax=Paenibacillus hamazuiensis TaxID=2936508 RepID=UPI00200BE319|nr:GNAT family N-acetyltransferase [Paenibacillus hamazuiensis]